MPIRMCMVCRGRTEKSGLIRAVVSQGKAVVDKTGKAQQRGFYLCPDCVGDIKKKRTLERVLKRSVEPAEYEEFINSAVESGGEKSDE